MLRFYFTLRHTDYKIIKTSKCGVIDYIFFACFSNAGFTMDCLIRTSGCGVDVMSKTVEEAPVMFRIGELDGGSRGMELVGGSRSIVGENDRRGMISEWV